MSPKLKVKLVENDGGPPWVVFSDEIKVARLDTEVGALQILHKLENLQARAKTRMVLVREVNQIKEEAMKKTDYPMPKSPPKKNPKGGGKGPKPC